MNALRLWRLSMILRRASPAAARAVKGLNLLLYGAVLPPEATVGRRVTLGHQGLGIVVHPNVVIGNDVHLWHRVTLAVQDNVGSASTLIIGDGVTIATGAAIITPLRQSLYVGAGSVIAANSVVLADVPPHVVVGGNPARVLGPVKDRSYR